MSKSGRNLTKSPRPAPSERDGLSSTQVIADEELSLNEIEHGVLRTHFDEPRVHACVNCRRPRRVRRFPLDERLIAH